MHFEIVATQVIVRRAARALTKISTQEVAEPMTAQDLLDTTVVLGPAAASILGKEKGDSVTVLYLLEWGGPGVQRLEHKLDAIAGQLDKLLHPEVDAHPVPPS